MILAYTRALLPAIPSFSCIRSVCAVAQLPDCRLRRLQLEAGRVLGSPELSPRAVRPDPTPRCPAPAACRHSSSASGDRLLSASSAGQKGEDYLPFRLVVTLSIPQHPRAPPTMDTTRSLGLTLRATAGSLLGFACEVLAEASVRVGTHPGYRPAFAALCHAVSTFHCYETGILSSALDAVAKFTHSKIIMAQSTQAKVLRGHAAAPSCLWWRLFRRRRPAAAGILPHDSLQPQPRQWVHSHSSSTMACL